MIEYFASISVGNIYILKTILPMLTISKSFQAGVVSFANIAPKLQYAKDQLKEITTNDTYRSAKTGTMFYFYCNVNIINVIL